MKKYGTKSLDDMSNPKNWEIWEAPLNQEVLYQTFPEFTCLCPRSGYPDFAKVHMISIPDKKVVEMKCLKLWLNSFRNRGISHENATQEIAKTLFDTLDLRYIFVLMEYTPRGNLTTFPMTELSNFRGYNWSTTSDKLWADRFPEEVNIIKRRLLEKLI